MQAPEFSSSAPSLEPRRFPCTQCGASLEFAPGTDTLRCEHCGHQNQITRSTTRILEEDFRQMLKASATSTPTQEEIAMDCISCGASYRFDAATHAGQCPFCGAPVVAKTRQHRQLPVQALLPFQVKREQAWTLFQNWLSGLWFAPNRLQNYARNESRLAGMYVPYWTYDAATTTTYQGERGDNYTVQERYLMLENGQKVERVQTVIKVRWTPVTGQVSRFFDDVLVLASRSLPPTVTQQLEPWDLANLVPYQEDYLSGFQSQMYQVDLEHGFKYAQARMAATIQQDIAHDIGGDHQRINGLDTRYGEIRYKHVLLPIWLSAFRFRDKTYRFVVNGRTGEVQGERPYSPFKIALAILLAILLLGGSLVLWQYFSASQSWSLPQAGMRYGLTPSILSKRIQNMSIKI